MMDSGVPLKHERIGEAGSGSWIYGAPHNPKFRELETWFASEQDTVLRESENFKFSPIVHSVRHPLRAIASLTTCFCGCGSMSCGGWADEPSWEWAGKNIHFSQKYCKTYRREGLCIGYGADTEKGRLLRSMEYWIQWNEMIEDTANFRMKMEDYDVNELSEAAGWNKWVARVEARPFTRKSATKKQMQLTWEKLRDVDEELEARVWQIAQRYGYTRDVPSS